MARVTRVAPHLTLEEVKQKLHTATKPWLQQRWMVIYTALLAPRRAEEIAAQLGVSRPFVSKITSLYKRFGPQGLETVGPGGRRNEYLSKAEEATFLAPFIERAAQGEIVTAKLIQQALALWELAPKGRYFVVSRCWFKGFISTQIEREALKDVLEIKDAVTPALQHLYPVIEPFYKPTRVSIAKVIRNSVHMLR